MVSKKQQLISAKAELADVEEEYEYAHSEGYIVCEGTDNILKRLRFWQNAVKELAS